MVETAENSDRGGRSGAFARDDVDITVTVHVPCGNGDAAGERKLVREEVVEVRKIAAAIDSDARRTALALAGDDVVDAIVIHVSGSDIDAPEEIGPEGKEVIDLRSVDAAEDLDARRSGQPLSGHD